MTEEKQLEPLESDASAAELLETGESAETSAMLQFCVFRAGRERFCLPVLEIEEVVDWPLVTKIPLAPAFLMGVFNLRGSIIPVVDIAVTEGRRPGLSPRSVVVAVASGNEQAEVVRIGIAADEVIGTYPGSNSALLSHSPEEMPHCEGMLQHEDRLALVVNLERLLHCFQIPTI